MTYRGHSTSTRDGDCGGPQQRLEWAASTTDALRVLEGTWKTIILCRLLSVEAPLHFSDLERRINGINPKDACAAARATAGRRHRAAAAYAQIPPRIGYALTQLGSALGTAMQALIEWTKLRRMLR
ncbi:winged helix-turn-helix transcriptional regulator [Xanthomonas campestris pv. raphani]|uniref:winged helix-turn-helix transcriptional regulator n=1 Tax=Xanthomonas campestris TaxID=339 RepID=UPI002AD520C5|nr:winged helix-turn-helix transcriptional regulator [Xanthomonas campestris]MEA0737914.1 winged helix-turn-helix transcriptional regulator [Xanthomonas campestris pv. campestris]MEA9786763.1 winged helix-turn-helix transcriptional regulator [Xanthomonas campestris pv. raphani]